MRGRKDGRGMGKGEGGEKVKKKRGLIGGRGGKLGNWKGGEGKGERWRVELAKKERGGRDKGMRGQSVR